MENQPVANSDRLCGTCWIETGDPSCRCDAHERRGPAPDDREVWVPEFDFAARHVRKGGRG